LILQRTRKVSVFGLGPLDGRIGQGWRDREISEVCEVILLVILDFGLPCVLVQLRASKGCCHVID